MNKKRLSEIENLIAYNKLSAAQVFTQMRQLIDDRDLLGVLDAECWDVRCINLEDTWMWQIVGHYMGDKPLRILGESWEAEGLAKAIAQAVETTKDDQYNYLYQFTW